MKPEDKLLKEFNAAGIHFTDNWVRESSAKYTEIEIEIGVLPEAELKIFDFAIEIVNRRGVTVSFVDWAREEREGQSILKFKAVQRVPEEIQGLTPITGTLGMSYLDLCWYSGNEATGRDYDPDVFTKPRADAVLTDLGWYLPTRSTDALISALGKLNDTILTGLGENAILYVKGN